MRIKVEIEYDCPNGFYCRKGKAKCYRMEFDKNENVFCSVYNRFLNNDSKGNVIKCDECLIAEKEERLSL